MSVWYTQIIQFFIVNMVLQLLCTIVANQCMVIIVSVCNTRSMYLLMLFITPIFVFAQIRHDRPWHNNNTRTNVHGGVQRSHYYY